MAKKEIVFNLRTETGNSVKDLKEMEKSAKGISTGLTDAGKSATDMDRAVTSGKATRSMEELNKTIEEGNFSLRDANKLIQEYQTIALQAGRESPVGREALSRAAALTDRVGDLRNEVNRLAQDGQAMQGALALGQGVVAGYSAFQGVTAMLGVENEKMLETITKLQAAQSTLMGIEQIRAALEKESVLMLQAKVAWSKAQTLATNVLSRATAGATVQARAFNAAMAVGIIGAITLAIGLLVQNWEKLTDAIGFSKKEDEDFTEEAIVNTDNRIKSIQDEVSERDKLLNRMLNQKRLEGASEEELSGIMQEETENRKELLEERLAREKQYLAELQTEQDEKREWASAKTMDAIQADIDARQENADFIIQKLLEIEDAEQASRDRLATANKAHRDRKAEEDNAAFALEEEQMMAIRDARLRMSNDEIEIMKAKHADEREEIIAKYGAESELLVLLQQEQDAQLDELKRQQGEEDVNKRKALLAQLRELEANDAEMQRILAEEKWIEDQELLAELRDQELISEEEFLMKRQELQQRYQGELERIAKDSAAKQTADELKKYSDMAAAAQSYVQSAGAFLSDLNALSANLSSDTTKNREKEAKRQFAIDKAVSIAQATIAGALGIIQTIGTMGMPAAIPFVAISAATSLASIAAIASTKYQGGGGGGGGGGFSAPSISAPTAEPVPQTQGENRVQVDEDGAIESAPMSGSSGQQQVVVLASDVQDVNNQNNEIDAVSTIGG